MPRTCTICVHDKRTEIDKASLDGSVIFRHIAAQRADSTAALGEAGARRDYADAKAVPMIRVI